MSMRGIEAEYNLTIDERNEIMNEPFVVKIKTKTADLTGAALDWAVAECEGDEPLKVGGSGLAYSKDWLAGGPIIEREGLAIGRTSGVWYAFKDENDDDGVRGETPLIAAMRCYVASRLGDEVNVPEEFK